MGDLGDSITEGKMMALSAFEQVELLQQNTELRGKLLEIEKAHLETQAHAEVMQEAFELVSAELDAGAIKTAESLCLKYNTLFAKPPSEALQQYGYEQRALALEEAANWFDWQDLNSPERELNRMAQEK